jgi:hypothetical protein
MFGHARTGLMTALGKHGEHESPTVGWSYGVAGDILIHNKARLLHEQAVDTLTDVMRFAASATAI